jgi:3-phenylpropionate/cinnamic acid dioxygenase small subunit
MRLSNLDASESLAIGLDVLEREALYLDEWRWDEWLALFTEDCEFWMPAWKTGETMTSDPETELSHFYYASRAGLADRLVRLRSGRSAASTPLPRTTHMLANIRLVGPASDDRMRLRSSWVTHVYFPRTKQSHAFFGRSEHELGRDGDCWLIRRKKIVLQNDYIPTMLDINCV